MLLADAEDCEPHDCARVPRFFDLSLAKEVPPQPSAQALPDIFMLAEAMKPVLRKNETSDCDRCSLDKSL